MKMKPQRTLSYFAEEPKKYIVNILSATQLQKLEILIFVISVLTLRPLWLNQKQ
jgi:hypothetical protein